MAGVILDCLHVVGQTLEARERGGIGVDGGEEGEDGEESEEEVGDLHFERSLGG